MKFFSYAAAALLVTTAPAGAATLIVDSNGILTGATGVNVNGSLFDVQFFDDILLDNPSVDAVFANAAGQALLSQVFVDGAQGNFDSNPGLTAGCAPVSGSLCETIIPYGVSGRTVSTIVVQNLGGISVGLKRQGTLSGDPHLHPARATPNDNGVRTRHV